MELPQSNLHLGTSTRTDTVNKTFISPDTSINKSAIRNNVVNKNVSSNPSNEPSEPITPLPAPKLTAPLFPKKAKSQEGGNITHETTVLNRLSASDNVQGSMEPKKVAFADGAMKKEKVTESAEKVQFRGASNPFAKPLSDLDVRPKNPFAKSSNSQEKASLLDSIKKMKSLS